MIRLPAIIIAGFLLYSCRIPNILKKVCGGDLMNTKPITSKGFRTAKAFILSYVCLFILFAAIGFLIRYTPLPERWMQLYVLAALCVSCFLIGLLTGNVIQKKGILFGALFTIIFVLILNAVTVLLTGSYSEAGILQLRYLPCVFIGSFGGMIGVNL